MAILAPEFMLLTTSDVMGPSSNPYVICVGDSRCTVEKTQSAASGIHAQSISEWPRYCGAAMEPKERATIVLAGQRT